MSFFKKGKGNGPQTQKERNFENVFTFLGALVLVFAFRSAVFEAFKIPSGSMIPTLWVGDRILVNKMQYGIKIPFSDLILDEPIYLIRRGLPQRGDVIVFLFPKDPSINFIKRVIGVPGDRIEIRNRELFINDKKVPRELVSLEKTKELLDRLGDPKYNLDTVELYTEHLGPVDHAIFLDKNSDLSENRPPKEVPPNSYFVMGDNRDGSSDSRYWGFVPMKNIRGKAELVWMNFTLPWNFFDSPMEKTEVEASFKLMRTGTLIR